MPRFNRRRSNLHDMSRLSTSCPVVDSSRLVSAEEHSDPDSPESSDFEDRAATGIQQHWAQQSVRRDRQKNLAHQRNMEQNKISMDDYFGKQAEFRIWLMEEQKKLYADLSSPKRRTYFKMFMRMWNKRSLPAKYFECRISKHVEDSSSSPEFCEPHEHILQLRPQDLNLFPRSPVLDPSIFPHSVDLSDDSFSASTSSPFSTFGKSAVTSRNFKPFFTSPLTRESEKNSGTDVKEGTYETKDSTSGSNKENADTRFSYHVTAASRTQPRTAVINPSHKLLINSPYSGSNQQEVMTRKKPQLTPVNSPQCPADQHLTGKNAGTYSHRSSNLNANTQSRLMRFQETRNLHHLYGACEQTGTIGVCKPQIAPSNQEPKSVQRHLFQSNSTVGHHHGSCLDHSVQSFPHEAKPLQQDQSKSGSDLMMVPKVHKASHYEALLGSSSQQALMNSSQGHYQEVKDSVSPAYSSPVYIEPFLIVPDSSESTTQDLEEKLLKAKELKVTDKQKAHSGKTHRRRSRSLDETSVYALPLKNGLNEGLHRHWTVSDENLQTSPPPLPPRLYNTKKVNWSSDASNTIPGLKPLDHINFKDTPLTAKSSSKKRFLQFLWSTKSEHVNKPHSLKVQSEKNNCILTDDQEKRDCESFPLVKMEKSPVLGRRNVVACCEAKATGRTIKVLTSNICDGNSHNRATINSDGCSEDNVSRACSLSKAQNCISPSNQLKFDEKTAWRRDSPDKMSFPQVYAMKSLSRSSSRRRSKSMEDISCSLKETTNVNFAWSGVPQHLKQRENHKLLDPPQRQMSSDENKDTASICAGNKLQRTNSLQDKEQMPQRKVHVSLHEEQNVSQRFRTVPHVTSVLQTADGRVSHTQGEDNIMGKLEETKSSRNELGILKELVQLDSSPKRLGQVKNSSTQVEMEFDDRGEPSDQVNYLPRDVANADNEKSDRSEKFLKRDQHEAHLQHNQGEQFQGEVTCVSTHHQQDLSQAQIPQAPSALTLTISNDGEKCPDLSHHSQARVQNMSEKSIASASVTFTAATISSIQSRSTSITWSKYNSPSVSSSEIASSITPNVLSESPSAGVPTLNPVSMSPLAPLNSTVSWDPNTEVPKDGFRLLTVTKLSSSPLHPSIKPADQVALSHMGLSPTYHIQNRPTCFKLSIDSSSANVDATKQSQHRLHNDIVPVSPVTLPWDTGTDPMVSCHKTAAAVTHHAASTFSDSVMHHNARLVQSVQSSSRHASPVLHTNKPAVETSMHCITTPHTSNMPPDPNLYVTGIPAEPSLNSISSLHTSSIPADPSLHAMIIPTESLLQSFAKQHSNMPSDPIQFTTTTLASPTKDTAVKAGLVPKARSVDISLYTERVENATTTMSSDQLLRNTTSSDSIGLEGSTDNAALVITSMCDQLLLTSPTSSEVNSPSSPLLKNSGPDLLLARFPDPVFTHPRTPEPTLSTGTKLSDPERLTSAIGQPLHSSPVKVTFSTWTSSVIPKTLSAVKTEITASGQAASVSSLEGIRQAKEGISFCRGTRHAFCSADTNFLNPSSHQVGQGNHLEGPPVIQKQNMLKKTGPKLNAVCYPGSFSSIEQGTSAISNSAVAGSNSTIQLSTLSKCRQGNRRRSRSVGDLATDQIEATSGCHGTQGEACQESVPSFSSLKSFWSKQNQTQVKSNKFRLPHSPSLLLTAPSFLSQEVPAGVFLSKFTDDDQKMISSCINHHNSQIAAERQARPPFFTRQSSCSEVASFSKVAFSSANSASLSLKAPVDNVNNSKGGGAISREMPPTLNQSGSTSASTVSFCQNSCPKWNFSFSPSKKVDGLFNDGNFLHGVYPDSHHALRPTDLVTNPGPECSSPKHISASLECATDRPVHTFPLETSPSQVKHETPPTLSAPSASHALCFSTLCQQTSSAGGIPALSGQLSASVQKKTAFPMNGYKSPSKMSSSHRLPSSVPKSDSPGKTSISRHQGTISLPQEPPMPDHGFVNPARLSSKLSLSLGMTPSLHANPESSKRNMGFLAQMAPSLPQVPVTQEGDCSGRFRMSFKLTSPPSYQETSSLASSIDISEQSQGKAGSSGQGWKSPTKTPLAPFSPLLTHPLFHKDDSSEMTPNLLEEGPVSLQNTPPFSDLVCGSPSKVSSSLSLLFLPETSGDIFSFRKTLSPSIQQNVVSVRDVPESEEVRSTSEKVFDFKEQMVSRHNQETPTDSKKERVMSGHSQETPTDGRREQTVPEHSQETPNDRREHVRETTGDGESLPVQRSPFITTRRSSAPRNKQIPCWEDNKESASSNPDTFGAGNFVNSGTNVSPCSGLPTTPKTRSATLSSSVNAAQTVEQTIHRTGKRQAASGQEKGSIFCSSLQFSPGAKPSPPPKPPKPLVSYQTRKTSGAQSVSNFAFKATFQTVPGQGHSRGRCGQPVTPIRGQKRQSQEQNTREDTKKDEQKVGMLVEREGANSSGMSTWGNVQWPRVQQLASGQTVSIGPSKRRSSGRTAAPSVSGRCSSSSSSRLAEGSSSARRRSSGRTAKTPAATPQEVKAGAELEKGSKASRLEKNACVVPELVVYHFSPGARLAETRRRSNGRQGVTKADSFRDSPDIMRVTSQTKRRSSGAHATDVRRSGSLARRRSSGRQDAALVATSSGGTQFRTVKKRSSGRVSTAGTSAAARRRSGSARGGLVAAAGLKSAGIAISGPGGAASKGKIRGNPRQSPTFIRIMRRLHTDEFDNSDDEDSKDDTKRSSGTPISDNLSCEGNKMGSRCQGADLPLNDVQFATTSAPYEAGSPTDVFPETDIDAVADEIEIGIGGSVETVSSRMVTMV